MFEFRRAYDPKIGTFSSTGSMTTARDGHTTAVTTQGTAREGPR